MDGWETLTALRNLVPDLPVILASSYEIARVMAGDHPELLQVFLSKPYNLKGLSDAISHTQDPSSDTPKLKKQCLINQYHHGCSNVITQIAVVAIACLLLVVKVVFR